MKKKIVKAKNVGVYSKIQKLKAFGLISRFGDLDQEISNIFCVYCNICEMIRIYVSFICLYTLFLLSRETYFIFY